MSVFNASRLIGKTVLITGASAGIGAVRLGFVRKLADPTLMLSSIPAGHRRPLRQGTD